MSTHLFSRGHITQSYHIILICVGGRRNLYNGYVAILQVKCCQKHWKITKNIRISKSQTVFETLQELLHRTVPCKWRQHAVRLCMQAGQASWLRHAARSIVRSTVIAGWADENWEALQWTSVAWRPRQLIHNLGTWQNSGHCFNIFSWAGQTRLGSD